MTTKTSFVQLHLGDARDVCPTLEPCDQAVTSPPYFRQRALELPGAVGQGSLDAYLEDVADVASAIRLSPTGSLWMVVGDRFSGKELLLVPERLALRLRESGWRLRWRGVWHKPNVRPESAKDRPTIDYESILMFVRSGAYYSDMDALREPAEWLHWGAQTSAKARANPLLSPLRRTTPCGSAAELDVVGVVVVGVVVGLVVVTVVVVVSVDMVVSSAPLSARAASVPIRAPPMKRIAPTTAAATSVLLRSPPSPLAPRDSGGAPGGPRAAPDQSCIARVAPRGPWTARHPARRTSRPRARGAEWRADPSSWSRRYFLDRKAPPSPIDMRLSLVSRRKKRGPSDRNLLARGCACRRPAPSVEEIAVS